MILLFAAAAGLPRAFVQEEETHTATALRLSATPSALFCGKLLYGLTLVLALEVLVTPVYLAMMNLAWRRPALLVIALAAGGYGLAVGSTLVAAIIAQARSKGTLFSVLAVPGPAAAAAAGRRADPQRRGRGGPGGVALPQLLLYDASVTVAGLMLFPGGLESMKTTSLAWLLWLWISPGDRRAPSSTRRWPQDFIGQSSRILFFHVPMAWASFVAFFAAGVWSVLYL